ncbi:MAG: hypothetical protein ACR2L8_02890 [Solirubrobacteraceae bacterium]
MTAALAAIPAAGDAALRQAPEPWATVNVCDTTTSPNDMGIRGSMSGLARNTRMYMRFRVQYRDANGDWRTVKAGADSRWRKVAAGRCGEHDAGWTFEFMPPTSGGAHLLRGSVSFQWRRQGHVVQRERRITEPGHPGTAGAEPADFSAATCAIA